MSELLPCPFCGSADINTEGPCYDAFMCNGCGVSQYDQPGHAEAIAAWNTRADASCQAEIERLTEALEMCARLLPRYRLAGRTTGDDEELAAVLETVTEALGSKE